MNAQTRLHTGILIIAVSSTFRRVYCVAGVILSVLHTSNHSLHKTHMGCHQNKFLEHKDLESSAPELLRQERAIGNQIKAVWQGP